MTPDKQAAQLQSLLTYQTTLKDGVIKLYQDYAANLEQLLQATRRNGDQVFDPVAYSVKDAPNA